jgi:cell wall-associated NlpC family hydrolase
VTAPAGIQRIPVAAALVLIMLLTVQQGALADPQPTVAQARAKLVKLNEQADDLVEKYNRATETYKKAKKKYTALNADLKRKSARADALRAGLVAVAVDTYQFGGAVALQGLIIQDDPQSILNRMASIDQMAEAQSLTIRGYEETTKELRGRRDQAKAALSDAVAARDKVREEKTKVEKTVEQQLKLLRRLGTLRTGNTQSTGVKYTGAASGDARTALQFAFAQIGKPYRFGGTGPDSYDCSGFAQASWGAAGVELPRTTYDQWAWGANRRVSLDELQPGDLLFSKGLGHMGIYAGDGRMVHSPQTGDVVKVVSIDDYWRGRFLGAVRP